MARVIRGYRGLKAANSSIENIEIENQVKIDHITKKWGLKKNILDFGIENNGSQPSQFIIQQAEDEANLLATTLGIRVALEFPTGVYMTEKTINKKSNVDWVGQGMIIRDPNNITSHYALLLADGASDFIISGIKFSNLPHHIAHTIPSSYSKSIRNCCIHLYESVNAVIDKCSFENYSEGVVRTASKGYKITDNYFNSKVEGKSIDQFLDDSYTDIAGAQTGDITGWVLALDAHKCDEDFTISGNHCLSVGLRIGIEVMTQAATHSRGIITGNIIKGLHQGIKLYKGTYGTLSNAVTNVRQTIISNNQISYCREIGIYIRANLGTLCTNNFVSYCGLFNTGAGSAYGGIVSRISAEVTDTTSTLDAGNFITGNYVYNCGKSNGIPVPPRSIHVRNANISVTNNHIVQDSRHTTKVGFGIQGGSGDDAQNFNISNNRIFNFDVAIDIANNVTLDPMNVCTINNNNINNANKGISIYKANNIHILSNLINRTTEGIYIRGSLYSIVKDNRIMNGNFGITIADGTFANNIKRTSATMVIIGNILVSMTEPLRVVNTAVGDISFAGRCKYFANNLVDWMETPS